MKFTPEKNRFRDGALAADESKFEKPEIGPPGNRRRARMHFGRKLQQLFPVPPYSSEPENVRILLRKIQAKFDKPPAPGDGERLGIAMGVRTDVEHRR